MKARAYFTIKPGLNKYINLVIGILAVLSLVIIFHWIADKISKSDAAILSFAFTASFIAGIYIGRYISYLWANSHKLVQNGLLIFLPILIFVTIVLTNIITNKILTSTNPRNYYGPSK